MGEDKEISISIRMGTDDLQMLEDFMSEKGLDNRSRFVRDAIAGYINAQKRGSVDAERSSGVFVRLREVQMEALRLMMEDGTIFNEEEFIRKCVLEKLVSREAEADSADRAFKAAKMTSDMK